MKLFIYCNVNTVSDYAPFAEILAKFGIEVTCVHGRLFLSQSGPFKVVPDPTLIERLKRFNPDLVILDSLLYTPKMAKLTGRKVIYHMIADVWSEYSPYKTPRSFFARLYYHYLSAILDQSIQDTNLVLANSKWLLNIVKEKIPKHPANLFYTGIDANEWVPHQKTPSYLKYPAVVGIFDFTIYQKVSGLLKFTEVIRKMPDVNFYFAGNGPYFNLVKQSCPPNMFLIGRVSKPDVAKLLGNADIFVHPSGLDVLPRSVKEASLMEKPIIASNVGGIPEIIKNNQTGYLCEIDDVDQWIAKIRFLLDNPDVARMFGKNARKFVMETFDWKKISQGFIETLQAFRE